MFIVIILPYTLGMDRIFAGYQAIVINITNIFLFPWSLNSIFFQACLIISRNVCSPGQPWGLVKMGIMYFQTNGRISDSTLFLLGASKITANLCCN